MISVNRTLRKNVVASSEHSGQGKTYKFAVYIRKEDLLGPGYLADTITSEIESILADPKLPVVTLLYLFNKKILEIVLNVM